MPIVVLYCKRTVGKSMGTGFDPQSVGRRESIEYYTAKRCRVMRFSNLHYLDLTSLPRLISRTYLL